MGHRHLSLEKREIIERLLGQGCSKRKIARVLGYSPSAISQEVRRNSAYLNGCLVYRHEAAHKKTTYRRKVRRGESGVPQQVVEYVAEKLKLFWSPEQIEGRLKLDFPHQTQFRICFKTIYRWIECSIQRTSPLGTKARYTKYLRIKRQGKRLRQLGKWARKKSQKLPSIEDRPVEAEQKQVVGHWEGDLICAYRGNGHIITMVDKATGYLVAEYCRTKHSKNVNSSICKLFLRVDNAFIKTITFDRGSEFFGFKELEKKFKCEVYYCHPQSPNERALNEQTNGLLRQFFPKRRATDFTDKTRLKWAVDLINNRPKKKFGYRTTWEVIEERGLAPVLSFI